MPTYLDPSSYRKLPVIIIGAGPIGLAAAAHLTQREEPFVLLDQTDFAGSSQRSWGHVRLFTPWKYDVDPTARVLLEESGWTMPDEDIYPTGHELRDRYLLPLASHPVIQSCSKYGRRVTGIARRGIGITDDHRMSAPFEVQCDVDGKSETWLGRAVIDASGTWGQPNSILANGLPLPNQAEFADWIHLGVPDVLGAHRSTFVGQRTLIVGSGHSAMNVVRDLVSLAENEPDMEVLWAIRGEWREDCDEDSFLTERTLLRRDTRELVHDGRVNLLDGIRITGVVKDVTGLIVETVDGELPPVDHVVVCTGFRPDLSIERELRTEIFSVFECVYNIAELIDPDRNACGTVPPHGVERLRQPEPDFFILGSKSYGRCGTFLMYTGYEQVRSVVAELCDDETATDTVLTLPDSGLCSACDAWLAEYGSSCACGSNTDDCCDDTATPLEEEVLHV